MGKIYIIKTPRKLMKSSLFDLDVNESDAEHSDLSGFIVSDEDFGSDISDTPISRPVRQRSRRMRLIEGDDDNDEDQMIL